MKMKKQISDIEMLKYSKIQKNNQTQKKYKYIKNIMKRMCERSSIHMRYIQNKKRKRKTQQCHIIFVSINILQMLYMMNVMNMMK